ncbi:hypothetical protein BDV24DRAFT_159878 [Aspergillus arachidicola]|uniref:BZIP transcription factor n=1 Tax=Aspergillus arachidicola TaxID=656916 RepID=A0A5N6YHR3_9EURO|nr:hypothetical protein BDV24DRAFT_159878 [Aspergillus arachidicola]
MSGPESGNSLQGKDSPRGRRTSRRVSRLTSQQAEHKRELDRTSQKAYRQRVKSRIQNLEDELARMKADSGSSQQTLLHKIEVLHTENRDLRARLESIRRLAINDGSGVNNYQRHDAQSPETAQMVYPEATTPEHEIQSSPPARNQAAEDGLIDQTDTAVNLRRRTQARRNIDPAYKAHPTNGNDTDPPLQNVMTSYKSPDAPRPTTIQDVPIQTSSHNDYAHEEGPNIPQLSQASPGETYLAPIMTNETSPSTTNTFEIPTRIECVMPKHTPGVYPIEKILLDFISSRRALADRGLPTDAVLGPDYPLVHGFVNPENIKGVHPTCEILTEILLTFRDVALPEKLAFMFVMFRNLRWQLSSSKFDYEEMPRWLRPTAVQITVPHSAWIDNLPWPQMRDTLIENPDKYPYSNFSALYSPNVSVNWPYDPMDTVMEVENGMILNPIFEKHIRKLENWNVSGPFKEYLPGLAAAIGQ